MFRKLLFIIALSIPFTLISQNTVGLISYKHEKAFEGYNLIYPHNQGNVYLLNNCGEIVHTWEDGFEFHPGITAYLTPEGKLVKAKRLKNITQDRINAGGSGGIVEIRDWDNNLEWSYELNDSIHRLHHDIAPMPNGNILLIVWELKTKADLIQAGRDTSRYTENELLSDAVFEINPATNQIVWKWSMWDHMIQDYDASKDNFGVVADHPEKIDINYNSITGGVSWLHANSIDYNPFLDQIMLSIPTFNEIWIIDHSTTTSQASGSIGGLSGMGGDLMYRWGNPKTYRKDEVVSQKLFFQHDAHWIQDFIPITSPDFGKIAVFNNRVGADFSSADIFSSPWDMYEWKYNLTNGAWGPQDNDKAITHPQRTSLYSNGLSSLQLLPNNNLLIHSGRQGYAFEITADNEIVWEYKVPLKGGLSVNQGSNLVLNDNLTFRMKRYPTNFSAFTGKDFSPKGWLETNPDMDFCNRLVNTDNSSSTTKDNLVLFPNPANNVIYFNWNENTKAKIMDFSGREVQQIQLNVGINELSVEKLNPGLYFIIIKDAVAKAFNVVR